MLYYILIIDFVSYRNEKGTFKGTLYKCNFFKSPNISSSRIVFEWARPTIPLFTTYGILLHSSISIKTEENRYA